MTDTSKYGLHLFAGSDAVDVAKINENTEKIEAALAGGLQIMTGSYVGDGDSSRTLTLPVTPKLVILIGHITSSTKALHLLWQESNIHIGGSYTYTDETYLTLSGNKLVWTNSNFANVYNKTVHYLLFY